MSNNNSKYTMLTEFYGFQKLISSNSAAFYNQTVWNMRIHLEYLDDLSGLPQ